MAPNRRHLDLASATAAAAAKPAHRRPEPVHDRTVAGRGTRGLVRGIVTHPRGPVGFGMRGFPVRVRVALQVAGQRLVVEVALVPERLDPPRAVANHDTRSLAE